MLTRILGAMIYAAVIAAATPSAIAASGHLAVHELVLTEYRQATFDNIAVLPSTFMPYAYRWPPTVTRWVYIQSWCDPNADGDESDRSPACQEAGAMYDALLLHGIDPAIHYGQAFHETSLGRAGVGREPFRNLHGVQCHRNDGRIAETRVPWGNGCAGVYADYLTSVTTWARLIVNEYIQQGLLSPETAIAKYAPRGKDGNEPEAYVKSMQSLIDSIRTRKR